LKIYLDACVIIYLIEGTAERRSRVLEQIRDKAKYDSQFITSILSKLECLVRPKKDGNNSLVSLYEDFFSSQIIVTESINQATIEQALEYRVRFGFKTPDAIYLATAKEQNVDFFITADKELVRCTELNVLVIY